ncbi:putative Tyrosyl-DNA phosphodiesterase [Zostera marina]|uniref:Putative Tyrosyl-DNA phosphodiesterase n=1 Tax=Zostera marina TaxID=29655 RepID=A0A0K9PTH7_ZOSMR|nr:putative Tyrosyl-DNA phosphodiesterase [Zostera marina]
MTQQTPATIGFLVTIPRYESSPKIPVLKEGDTFLGRCHLSIDDKRVSRKHIKLCGSSSASSSNTGAVEIVVEGQNPVVILSLGSHERRKLCLGERSFLKFGDIIELIPGSYSYMYVKVDNECKILETEKGMGKRMCDDRIENVKRNRQIAEDEAFARCLQDEGEGNKSFRAQSKSYNVSAPRNHLQPIQHFRVSKDQSALKFRLMRVQSLPPWANTSSVSIGDVIQGNIQVAILSTYMVDLDWLLSACPALKNIPHVLLIHGESDAGVDLMKKNKPANWILHKPQLPISYGTHHSKAMILVYPKGVRIIVHTANLIHSEWNNKSQGLWMQDFPWKSRDCLHVKSPFENDLVDYISVLKCPEFSVNLPTMGSALINSSFFKKFDYSNAVVRLIASVPGYHIGPNLKRWGHMKLRAILDDCIFDKEFHRSPLAFQFSSLGSLDEKWLSELAFSMSSGFTNNKIPLGLGKPLIVWPTVEDVRCSLEGYAAGNSLASPQKNVEREFLKKYWARWKSSHTGRCRAMPHIKTYTRYDGQNLAWFLLTSANLSKAAWGSLQKNNSQFMIRSYEVYSFLSHTHILFFLPNI